MFELSGGVVKELWR